MQSGMERAEALPCSRVAGPAGSETPGWAVETPGWAFESMKAFSGLTEATGLAFQLHYSSKCV